jgi:hypothetical protein
LLEQGHGAAKLRIQGICVNWQAPLPGFSRKMFMGIRYGQSRALLNSHCTDLNSNQKEPGVLRQLDMLHLDGIENFTDMAKREAERIGNRFL